MFYDPTGVRNTAFSLSESEQMTKMAVANRGNDQLYSYLGTLDESGDSLALIATNRG